MQTGLLAMHYHLVHLHFSIKPEYGRNMGGRRDVWEKFALYGEDLTDVAPEFVHVEPVSARSSMHDWNIAAHSHPGMHQILLLETGAGRLVVDESEIELAPPVLVAVPSLAVHAFAFEPGSEGWVISLAVELLHDPRMTAGGDLSLFRRPSALAVAFEKGAPDLARLAWIMADLCGRRAETRGGGLSSIDLAQICLLLACADKALAQGSVGAGADRQQRLAERFRMLVDENYRRGWTVAEYARQLATTQQTLTRASRATFDKSPGSVIQERLAIEAMRYLKFSAVSVKEISDRLGFSEPAYFARFFRKMTGQTATQFRLEEHSMNADRRGKE